MLTTPVLSMLAFCLSVAANPIVIRDNLIRIPFSKHVNVTEPAHILKQDQARASAIISQGKRKSRNKLQKDAVEIGSVEVQNQAVAYLANVNIGNPATTCTSKTRS